MLYSEEGDAFTTCPYDSSHVIKTFRLPYHLLKCKEKHPGVKLENCRFNYSHLVKSGDMLRHLEACPSKSRIESGLYRDRSNECNICQNEYSENDEAGRVEQTEYVCESPRRANKMDGSSSRYRLNENKDLGNSPQVWMKHTEWDMHSLKSASATGDELEPLPLPKTTSKAFRIKRSTTK